MSEAEGGEAFPEGIKPEVFSDAAGRPELTEDFASIRGALAGRKRVVGADRLDHSKGIPERLAAFARLLELHPEWRRKVSLVQVSVPSRETVPEYVELRARVEGMVGRINGLYGEADWVPVRYLYRSYAPDVLAQLFRAAHVGLIHPLRDGMNLVAKEYVASQDPSAPGVLVLSRFAGAAEELDAALLTNPYHVDGMAAALHQALTMGLSERVERHRRSLARVRASTSRTWAAGFLAALEGTREPSTLR